MKSAITRVKRLSKMRLNIHERNETKSKGETFLVPRVDFFQAKLQEYIQVEEFQKTRLTLLNLGTKIQTTLNA